MLQVFLYVSSATVDLSVFGRDQASLIQSLRSAHRSLRFRPLLQQRKATIEGPFAAVQALRQDLIGRAGQLQSTVSAQTAAVKLKEAPLNTRVRSHHEFVSSVSYSGSKAKLEPASSNSLSTPLQTTGEAATVQTPLSNAKTLNTFPRQNVSCGSSAGGSFCSTDSDEEEQRVQSWLQMPTEHRAERAKANPGQVFGGEINARIRSPLSGLDLLPAEEISAKQAREDDVSQKHTRPDRVSATTIRGGNHLGSRYSSPDYLKESDQSSSAVTAELPRTRLKDVSQTSESDAKDAEELSAVCPEDPEDTGIFVDSYTLRYIERFDKKELDRCLRGLGASVESVEGLDLMQILLTEKQTSTSALRIHQALIRLSTLVDFWQSTLRVHQLDYDEEEQPEKQKLIQICDDVNFLFDDVLYISEDSCVKVIGPSVSSHLFYRTVKDRIAEHKDKCLRI